MLCLAAIQSSQYPILVLNTGVVAVPVLLLQFLLLI